MEKGQRAGRGSSGPPQAHARTPGLWLLFLGWCGGGRGCVRRQGRRAAGLCLAGTGGGVLPGEPPREGRHTRPWRASGTASSQVTGTRGGGSPHLLSEASQASSHRWGRKWPSSWAQPCPSPGRTWLPGSLPYSAEHWEREAQACPRPSWRWGLDGQKAGRAAHEGAAEAGTIALLQ